MDSCLRKSLAVAISAIVVASGCSPRQAAPNMLASDRGSTDISSLRAATNRFQQLDSAVAAGYPREVRECLVHEHHGAMGYHHVNRAHLARDIEVAKPQILLYERMPDSSYKLNAVEYIIPYGFWPRDSVAPMLMGRALHQEDNLKFWYLHVWAWRENPNGVFANFHPDVKCKEGNVYIPFPAENAAGSN